MTKGGRQTHGGEGGVTPQHLSRSLPTHLPLLQIAQCFQEVAAPFGLSMQGKADEAEQALGHSKPSLLEKYQKQKQASASGRPKDSSCLDEDWSEEGDSKVGEAQGPPEFFDPDLDEEDEAWVAQQRQGRKTDAILSCPCCLTTCCIDCQQHEDNPGQYRAMFVTNCRVDFENTMIIPARPTGGRKRTRYQDIGQRSHQAYNLEDLFHAVFCDVCGNRLGVYDSEDVFHFTSVIASEA